MGTFSGVPAIATLRTPLLCLATAVALGGCASQSDTLDPDNGMLQEALQGTGSQRPPVDPRSERPPVEPPSQQTPASPQRQIIKGNQRFIRQPAAAPAARPGETGDIVFNFTNQPIQAVINSIMGDLLHENYSIAQGVKGDVSFSTSKPVNKQQALSILETLLSWTDNAMIKQGNRYVILPSSQAVAGKLVPEMRVAQPSAGMSARLFPLRYISATEMQKLLKPFARENAFLLVDPARNVLSLAGTPEELANYQDTIDTFDVDWLKGMSVGVFGLQRASVGELMPELQKMFGPESGMPLAGMVRFLPIERTNSVVAISSQPEYLHEVGEWIHTIDEGGGNEPQMYVYDVRNMKATDLAKYLRQIYGTGAIKDDSPAKVAPGLRTTTLSSLNSSGGGAGGMSSSSGLGGNSSGMSSGGAFGSSQGLNNSQNSANSESESDDQSGGDSDSASQDDSGSTGNGKSLDASTRITAQKSSNQLLVRTRPAQWKEIESAIKRLDNPPLQVQIETRILEVKLTGELDMGVQWYLGRLAGNSGTTGNVTNTPGSQGSIGTGGAALAATDSFFYSFVSNNLQVALRALETNGRTQVLSAPSLVVMNNQQAQIQVGDNIPISQTTVNTNASATTLSSVEYVQTGVILDVVPRINPGGLVYMDIQQQVSDADNSANSTDLNGNPRISTRSVSTQVAAQSGQTVLLGGLIKQDNAESVSAVPYLGRIPGLKWLFGNTSKSKDRTELIVLITPRVITSSSQARQVTDDYRQQMQLLKPEVSRTSMQN
ncbi:type II secretion system secretin GspD [Pseudomonas cannabina]|uniref:Type II secretion system secretin GspD n=1 Tax=Pseudomonas syringae pv. maculicola str. ES4326 TaxID=629265 RepID=A0A8T8C1R8_PSEYM|nr:MULTISPECIES: type II secretion system secretin GspD [Pseudomonas syringae group]KPB71730.1 General secretion pathway protein D [Pseudomonas syringae pv. maculicola]QHE97622.1 type II secretion system secretin GspD [Pseudomonas syringae pv. maculicola str. ES4326]QQN24129.1 type II secretion system secretin GspD [Pseudomonas cannabina pv. alisalensis]UBY98296.1 type II secretion system secretin GspD [Pseudomonas cannabina pv. alisalensis]